MGAGWKPDGLYRKAHWCTPAQSGGVSSHVFDPRPVLTPIQVCDIAEGLHYLHSRDMFHGDLKGVCV